MTGKIWDAVINLNQISVTKVKLHSGQNPKNVIQVDLEVESMLEEKTSSEACMTMAKLCLKIRIYPTSIVKSNITEGCKIVTLFQNTRSMTLLMQLITMLSITTSIKTDQDTDLEAITQLT